jgi:hypothetical protein
VLIESLAGKPTLAGTVMLVLLRARKLYSTKHVYHSIVCIGALLAHKDTEAWTVDAVGAPHCGERSEKGLISSFVGRIEELTPQLVTFNGNAFDLPVLRYLVNKAAVLARPARGQKKLEYQLNELSPTMLLVKPDRCRRMPRNRRCGKAWFLRCLAVS